MYLDGTEITDLQSSLSKDINKYWYNCTGLKAGSHTVKLLATYEKAGGNFDIAEKSLTFEVISASKSSATVAKNTSATNTNTSADIFTTVQIMLPHIHPTKQARLLFRLRPLCTIRPPHIRLLSIQQKVCGLAN